MSPRSGLAQVVLDCPPHVAEKQRVNSWQWKKKIGCEQRSFCPAGYPRSSSLKKLKGMPHLSPLRLQQLFQSAQFQPVQQTEMQKMQKWAYCPLALMSNPVCPKETGSSKRPAAAPGSHTKLTCSENKEHLSASLAVGNPADFRCSENPGLASLWE